MTDATHADQSCIGRHTAARWCDVLLPNAHSTPSASAPPTPTQPRRKPMPSKPREDVRASLVATFVQAAGVDAADAEFFAGLVLRSFRGERIYFPSAEPELQAARDRQIVAETRQGLSLRRIAKRYGIGLGTAQRIVAAARDGGTVNP